MADFDPDIDELAEEPLSEPARDDVTPELLPDTYEAPLAGTTLHQELLQSSVNDYYDALGEKGLTTSLGRDYRKFELDRNGRLRLKAYPGLNIINSRTQEPLALTTVANQVGGRLAIREDLGFIDWTSTKRQIPPKVRASLKEANDELGASAAAVETIELRDLGQTTAKAIDTVQKMERSMTDSEIEAVLGTMNDPPLRLREIRGLDKALQRSRGELSNNLAKLSELDEHIAYEKRKLDRADTEVNKRRVAERLRDLEDERAARLEAASAIREDLRSQISRIRETIGRILNEDTTLGERIRTLFREQGITIVSIITAIGMSITALVLALTGGSAPTPTPVPSDKRGLKEWVKKHLQAFGRILAKLAGKAASALPGIIGSLVSWLLNLLGKTATWLAEHLWVLVVAVGGLLFGVAREWLSREHPKAQ